MTVLHAKFSLALCRSSQLRAETKHSVQAAVCCQSEVLRPNLGIADHRVSLVQQSNDISLELVWCCDGRLHQRLQHLRLCFLESLTESLLSCVLEGHF